MKKKGSNKFCKDVTGNTKYVALLSIFVLFTLAFFISTHKAAAASASQQTKESEQNVGNNLKYSLTILQGIRGSINSLPPIAESQNKSEKTFTPKFSVNEVFSIFSSGPVENYNLSLKKGWNLFSVPIIDNEGAEETNCEVESPLWRYSNEKNNYEATKNIYGAKEGFWIKAANDCIVKIKSLKMYTINNFFPIKLKKGLNFIGGIPAVVTFDKIKGNCHFIVAPLAFDSVKQQYYNPIIMYSGKGYIVAVENDCELKIQ